MILAMVPAAAIALDTTAIQDSYYPRANSHWRCGHTWGQDTEINKPVVNLNAGIVFLEQGSLNYLRNSETEEGVSSLTDEQRAARMAVDFTKDLFCGEYVSRYLNPDADNLAGVCIRNTTVGQKWNSILEADTEAKAAWEWFGTPEGYQKSTPEEHGTPSPDYMKLWGSGRSGNSPANWCGAYMKEMLCHIAFPQWAGNVTELNHRFFPGAPLGQRVRPVSSGSCSTLMNNCNRRQPKPLSDAPAWLTTYLPNNGEEDMDNGFYCDAWNRGLHLARAGTGVGAGADEEDSKYTAEWEASSSLTPIGFLAVTLTLLATLL
eukprot:TRINITY_DN72738_c0_g1_i1.p1 TRINITY_DN72738_c0_g1~~TRINITY_DN72738_c0_g1_i1.p1  ORF type:complete len:349 (+),score=112.00 TRINITY_DN72738_c0_g1_i1:93-1049(+)